MFHLTLQHVHNLELAYSLTIFQSDEDWANEFEYAAETGTDVIAEQKDILIRLKGALLASTPIRFHTYIEDGSLNLPGLTPTVRADYHNWQQAEREKFHRILGAASENKQKTLHLLQPEAQAIYSQTLHDAQILQIESRGNDLCITFDCSGGFTKQSVVILSFLDVVRIDGELEVGQFYVYDDLIRTDNGIALKVIYQNPESEVVIEAKTIDAGGYYRPKTYDDFYFDFHATDNLKAYLESLNAQHEFIWADKSGVTPIVQIDAARAFIEMAHQTIHEVNGIIYVNGEKSLLTRGDVMRSISTTIYEDPYAHFRKSVAPDELMDAAFSGDLELKVRAWNTMHAQAEELAPIINEILLRLTIADEDETMLYVFVRHFNNEGILTPQVVAKYKDVIID